MPCWCHAGAEAKVCDSQGHKKCVAQNVSRGLLPAEINGLIGRRMKARTSLDVLCSLHLGNGFQEDLQSVQARPRGTVYMHLFGTYIVDIAHINGL